MGCDIHMFAERKINGKWENIYLKETIRIYESHSHTKNFYTYDSRSYALFTALAGVRNSIGVPVISIPKGLPEDACDEVKKESEEYGVDGHSHSFLGLKDLLAYDWDRLGFFGVFDSDVLLRLKSLGSDYENTRIVFFFDN